MPSPAKRLDARGFTLIELMIVVVIIGILAALAIPKFGKMSRAAKEAEAAALLKQIVTLQERHKQKHDEFAPTLLDLEGGDTIEPTAVYYSFDLTAAPDGSDACAIANPTAAGIDAGVSPQSMNMARTLFRTNDCS